MRSEDRAAADPQRGTTRTAACATSTFLLPRLAPAAADERTGFRGMRAEPLRRELHDDRLMKESAVDFHAENIIIQLNIADLLAVDIVNCYLRHN